MGGELVGGIWGSKMWGMCVYGRRERETEIDFGGGGGSHLFWPVTVDVAHVTGAEAESISRRQRVALLVAAAEQSLRAVVHGISRGRDGWCRVPGLGQLRGFGPAARWSCSVTRKCSLQPEMRSHTEILNLRSF